MIYPDGHEYMQAFASSRMISMIILVEPQIILVLHLRMIGGRPENNKNGLWRPRPYPPNSHPRSTGLALCHHPSVILLRLLSGSTFSTIAFLRIAAVPSS
jgi:hypothetical protein